ncbi:MAG: 50S ribosomal protein L4 [Phycisphaeraceae bacterium]|nr:50S ribosomal protein L4 [Phycisphaerales bacterium]MCB9842629.1 50S ribosomal protein L4 [Phycisphaeraceae bacterium]
MQVPVLNMQGKQVGTMDVDEQALGGEINPALIKQAYVRYHANQRQGSARTKSRSGVEGSTRKLYRQKGTGNARAGSLRANIRRGGGRAFAKKKTREEFRLDMPIKMRRKANRNALLAKLMDNEVRVIDNLSLKAPKTKDVRQMLEAMGVDRTCLIAVQADNANVRLGARNIEHVTVCPADALTCFNMLNHRYVVISKSDLEAWISGPSAQTGKSAKAGKAGA